MDSMISSFSDSFMYFNWFRSDFLHSTIFSSLYLYTLKTSTSIWKMNFPISSIDEYDEISPSIMKPPKTYNLYSLVYLPIWTLHVHGKTCREIYPSNGSYGSGLFQTVLVVFFVSISWVFGQPKKPKCSRCSPLEKIQQISCGFPWLKPR